MSWIPALISAAQAGISYIPTAADKRRNELLKDLENREKAGELGLTDEERAAYEAAYMQPVRSQFQQTRKDQEAMMAQSGQTYGGQLLQAQQRETESMGRLAQEAGAKINAADVQEKEKERLLIDQLVADKAARQAVARQDTAAAIGKIGTAMGEKDAGPMGMEGKTTGISEADMRAAGWDEDDIAFYKSLASTPEGQAQLDAMLAELMAANTH